MSKTTTKAHVLKCTGGALPPAGSTANYNHEGCPAGEDTRRRLYVTSKLVPKNLVVWYCHNCGEGGAFKSTARRGVLGTFSGLSPNNEASIRAKWQAGVPIRDTSEVPASVLGWLRDSFADLSCGAESLRWHPVDCQLMFPIWREYIPAFIHEGEPEFQSPEALQLRSFDSYSPKYLTVKGPAFDGKPMGMLVSVSDIMREEKDYLVLCEDWLSAMTVYNAGPSTAMAYAMFGSHMSIDELARLCHEKNFKRALVWLDNDNEHVVESAALIAKRAKLVGFDEVRIERNLSDPKRYPDVIRERLFLEYEIA